MITPLRGTGRRLIGFAVLAMAVALLSPVAAPLAESASGSQASQAPIRLAQATTPETGAKAADAFSPEQKKAIEAIIKDYLIANPEVFLEVQSALEARMEEIQAKRLQVAIAAQAEEIYRSPGAPVAGNTQGDVTVVEFFDYNCGYCKRAFTDLAKVIEKDTKVKLVLKELPILSKGSEEAARVALAAKAQGKYWEVHRALLTMRGQANEQTALAAAEKAGLDMAKLKADMKGDAVTQEIARVRELAQSMGIQGTPHFLVGDRAIAGAPQNLQELMGQHIADIRKEGGCKVC
jgi:protein-disulfide isomerase